MNPAPHPKRETHAEALLALLRDGQWHKMDELAAVAGFRYGARIYDLRKLGYRVQTQSLGDDVWLYRLVPEAGQIKLL